MLLAQRDRVRIWENTGGRPGEWDYRIPLNEGTAGPSFNWALTVYFEVYTKRRNPVHVGVLLQTELHDLSRVESTNLPPRNVVMAKVEVL